jgi:hypothetical protein
VDAVLSGELAIVVEHGVKRHVPVLDVVRQNRGVVLYVLERVAGDAALLQFEVAPELPVDLTGTPRQRAVALHELDAVALDGAVVLARQRAKRRPAVRVEIHEMTRRLFAPAGVAPEIGIDRTLDDEGAMLLEKRSNGIGQQVDGAIGDETMRVKAPRLGPCRPQQNQSDDEHDGGRRAHAWYINV